MHNSAGLFPVKTDLRLFTFIWILSIDHQKGS